MQLLVLVPYICLMAARIIITKQGEDYQITYKSGAGLDMQANKTYKRKALAYRAIAGFIFSIYALSGIEVKKCKRHKQTNVIRFEYNGGKHLIQVTDKTVITQEPLTTKPHRSRAKS
jgi:hypothetical protein